MIKFELSIGDLVCLKPNYEILKISLDNYIEHTNYIENTINNFNNEIQWNEMFNLVESIERFQNSMVMFIGIKDNGTFGHVWFKKYNDGYLLFNLFVRNSVKQKMWSGKEFVSDIIDKFFKNDIIYSETDEWNIKSIKLFEKLGFIRY